MGAKRCFPLFCTSLPRWLRAQLSDYEKWPRFLTEGAHLFAPLRQSPDEQNKKTKWDSTLTHVITDSCHFTRGAVGAAQRPRLYQSADDAARSRHDGTNGSFCSEHE